MPTPALHEIANAIAAVASSIAGIAAAIAAFKSAASAKEAAASAAEASRRNMLREVSMTASSVALEALSAKSIAGELDAEYQSAMVFSGSTNHSSLQALREASARLAERAASFVPNAELFTGGARSLSDAPEHEIERVQIKLAENISTIKTIRDELERKCQAMRTLNLQSRGEAIRR